jgi:hypothetical protein
VAQDPERLPRSGEANVHASHIGQESDASTAAVGTHAGEDDHVSLLALCVH